MKTTTLLTLGASFALAASSAHAATIFQIDTQMAGSPTSQETQAGWSAWDVAKVTTNNSINATVAGVGITITANGGGYVTARGGTGERRGGEITGTSWNDVVEDFAVARAGNGTATIALTGLDASLTYTFTMWNNESYDNSGNLGFSGGTLTPSITTGTISGAADTGLITYLIQGARTDGDFDSTVISFTPDGSGNADILVSSTSNFVVISGMELTSVPEPSSAALLGLGGFALILRRRK